MHLKMTMNQFPSKDFFKILVWILLFFKLILDLAAMATCLESSGSVYVNYLYDRKIYESSSQYNTMLFLSLTVADPGFPFGGASTS